MRAPGHWPPCHELPGEFAPEGLRPASRGKAGRYIGHLTHRTTEILQPTPSLPSKLQGCPHPASYPADRAACGVATAYALHPRRIALRLVCVPQCSLSAGTSPTRSHPLQDCGTSISPANRLVRPSPPTDIRATGEK